jgi:2-methylisocitrate lyase-like PEP mutase family enzyme
MSDMLNQIEKAIQFRNLHRPGAGLLLLTNVWDSASARIIEESGFPAIATSSAAVAFSLGYPDGQHISRAEMIGRVAQIVEAVNIPVSADVEAGYGSTPEDVAITTRELIQAGAIGMNLEDKNGDQLLELPVAVEKIQAACETGAQLRVPVIVNARTDVYMFAGRDLREKYPEALRRLIAYRDAGADCVFVPGLRDADTIGQLVEDVQCPVNILAVPGAPPLSKLKELRVARVSLGSGPMRAGLGLLRRIVDELRTAGTYGTLEGAVTHKELDTLLAS